MKQLAWFLSFCTGFISLSEEILWVRIVSFAFESTPRAFALVLTAFLGGIALGALSGKRLSEQGKATPITVAWLLLAAGAVLLALPAVIGEIHTTPFSIFGMLLLIVIGAALKGTLFPIVHHMGSTQGDALGRSVSRIYFCNILGATLGPLVTGLILLDHFSSGTSLQLLGVLCFLCALVPLFFVVKTEQKTWGVAGVLLCFGGLVVFPLMRPVGASLMQRMAILDGGDMHVLIENRHGIIHSVSHVGGDDTVYGGNVYDGKTNIELVSNSNMIDRAYMLYGLHPAPKRVLVIGLSSGAWTRIIGAIPGVEQIDVVEINPGYIEMIGTYAHLSPLLADPRLNLHIDDGRRWLRRSRKKFDLIVMNTTYHWRANITNLLAIEMMSLVRNSLAPGGIFAFNTTNSFDSFYTASKVFPHAYMFRNFVYAANHDFREQQPQLVARLRLFQLDGQPLFQEAPGNEQALKKLSASEFIGLERITEIFPRSLQAVTDQNMITEFRFGRWAEHKETD